VRKAAKSFGVNHQWDRVTGPYPVEDTRGMFEAASMLLQSLDPIQNVFSMIPCKSCGGTSPVDTSVKPTLMDISDDIGEMFYSDQPRFELWSKQFSQGVHSQMGNSPRPNWLVTLDELQCIQVLL
jgi:hypothetical protein